MKSYIQEIVRIDTKYLDKDGQIKTAHEFAFICEGNKQVKFMPHETHFKERKNFNSYSDLSDWIVDRVIIIDKTKKDNKKEGK